MTFVQWVYLIGRSARDADLKGAKLKNYLLLVPEDFMLVEVAMNVSIVTLSIIHLQYHQN